MKRVALIAVMLAILPTAAFAGGRHDRGDRYDRGGRHHYDRGDRYDGHRDHHRSSRSSFSFSFGVSSGDWCGSDYSSFRYTYSNRPIYRERVVYVEPAPVYVAPPPVVYVPAPRVYYSEPCYTPRYYYSSRYYYCR